MRELSGIKLLVVTTTIYITAVGGGQANTTQLKVNESLVKCDPAGVGAREVDMPADQFLRALQEDSVEVIEQLFQQYQLPISCADIHGRTCLHFAVKVKAFNIVEWLLEKQGIHVNVRDKKGNTPLDFAAISPSRRIACQLIKAGGRRNTTSLRGCYSIVAVVCVVAILSKLMLYFVRNNIPQQSSPTELLEAMCLGINL